MKRCVDNVSNASKDGKVESKKISNKFNIHITKWLQYNTSKMNTPPFVKL